MKGGSEEEKASLMFLMLQDKGRLSLDQLETFGEKIAADEDDIREVIGRFRKFAFSDIELDNFIKIFAKLYKYNTVFNWMDYLVKPYKTLEEAKLNATIQTKTQMTTKKSISSLPIEVQGLVLDKNFDEIIVTHLHFAYQTLKENKMLTVKDLEKVINDYDIKEPLATRLARRCLPNEKDSSKDFIKVFYLLTQENATERRNKLLFSLYSKENKINS